MKKSTMNTTNKFLTGCLLLFLIALSACDNSDDGGTIKPKEKEPILTAEESMALTEADLDTNYVAYMIEAIEDNDYPNIHSVLIARGGERVFERYFTGRDQYWGSDIGVINHSVNTLHDMRSISKSFVSACIGIAIAKGQIEGVDQSIFDFFPDYEIYNTGWRSEMTIKDLLSMTSGIEWDESGGYDKSENSAVEMYVAEDPVEYVLSRPMAYHPGEVWTYNGGASQLLASIIEVVSGMPIDDYADEYLFEPLGIENFEWVNLPNKDIPAGDSGLRLRARDLMKFGQLYYNKGMWEGTRVLEESWVEDTFADHATRPNGEPYGYQFWILERTMAGHQARIIWASGNGDQCIFLDYENELLVIITAGNYNTYYQKNSIALLRDFIYPSLLTN